MDVGMGIDPQQADLLFAPAVEFGHAGNRPRRQRMVPAQQQGSHARFQRRQYGLCRPAAGLRNLLQVMGALVARRLGFGNLDADVAAIRNLMAKRLQPCLKASHAHRRGPHVHAAPARAQIQRHSEHANTAGRLRRAAGRQPTGPAGTRLWLPAHRHGFTSLQPDSTGYRPPRP